jgi:hypothetical protein
MQEVGAQHLICVSMKGYPRSIIEDVATTYGPTVKLLTLAELREQRMPGLSFIYPFVLHLSPHFTLESCGPNLKLKSGPSSGQIILNSGEAAFSVGNNQTLQSINELISQALNELVSGFFIEAPMEAHAPYHLELELGTQESDLWFHLEGNKYKVISLPVTVRVESTLTKIPLTLYSYHQESIDGTLAWVSSAIAVSQGQEVTIQLVFRRNAEGFLQVAAFRHQGLQAATLVTSPNKEAIESFVSKTLSLSQ